MHFPLRSAFLAIPLEGNAKENFRVVQKRLKPWSGFLRFQNPDTSHLTLTYWPSVLSLEYDGIVAQAKKIADGARTFELKLIGYDLFKNKGVDRVLFLGPHFSSALADLKKRCPWPNLPGQPFHPHVTLAFIDHAERFHAEKKKIVDAIGDIDISVTVDRLRLYAEMDGRTQTPIGEFPFGHPSTGSRLRLRATDGQAG